MPTTPSAVAEASRGSNWDKDLWQASHGKLKFLVHQQRPARAEFGTLGPMARIR